MIGCFNAVVNSFDLTLCVCLISSSSVTVSIMSTSNFESISLSDSLFFALCLHMAIEFWEQYKRSFNMYIIQSLIYGCKCNTNSTKPSNIFNNFLEQNYNFSTRKSQRTHCFRFFILHFTQQPCTMKSSQRTLEVVLCYNQ